MANIHPGSWNIFGVPLPDLGITEAIAGAFGQGTNAQGGSQLRQGTVYNVGNVPYYTSPTTTSSYIPPAATTNNYVAPQQKQTQSGGGAMTNNRAIQLGYTGLNDYNDQMARQQSQGSSSSYDSLMSQINGMADQSLAALDPQRDAQNQIIGNSYNQGVSDLQANLNQGNLDLGTQERKAGEAQTKTLNDLTNNLKNMFSAGQTYLGARGAGDSSAANQYSYALTQMGNKNRGDIMSQTSSIYNDINDRKSRLQNIYTQESAKLNTEKQNQLLQVSQWYADAQNQIRQTKSVNTIQLGQAALNQAISMINQVSQNNAQKNAQLQQWAISNAKNISQLAQNMQGISAYQAPTLSTQQLGGISNGAVGSNGQYYPGSNQTDNKLFM